MAIEKEELFKIIDKISNDKDLNEDNLLKKIENELKTVATGVYSTYNNLKIDKTFGVSDSDKIDKTFGVSDSDKIVNCTLLHLAVECNNISVVKLLLAKGLEVDKEIYELDGAKSKLTALHIAASRGYQEIIQLLLDANANPLLENNEGKTPRDIVDNVPNIVEMLKEGEQRYTANQSEVRAARRQTYRRSNNKASENYKNNEQTSSNLIPEGDDTLEKKQALRERDAMIEQLREAEQRLANNQKRVEQKYLHDQHLGQHKASLDLTTGGSSNNDSGLGTPSEEEVNLENVNVQDENALHLAAEEGHIEVVQRLIKGGANINVQDKNGYAPLHYAAAGGHIKIIQYLIKGGADINVQDKNGYAPLYYAVANDNKKLARYLIKHEADRSLIKDEDLIGRLDSYYEVAPSHSKTNNVIKSQEEIGKVKEPREKTYTQFIELLKQQVQELENQNTKLTETYKISLEKKQKEIEELKNCNESLKQEIKSLKSQRLFNSELNKTKISEVPLERAGLCFFKAASINFVTTLVILSIASNLPILSIIAASVMSALVAGGITYAMSEPATKFQEVDVSKATGKEVIS